jgi:hypothetical protein
MNISKNRPGQLPKTGRKETVAPQNNNPQSTPTVVNSNGHVEKVGKLSDLELDRWYFFASPETVKRIVEAQKTGNLPPELAKSSTEKNTEPQATQEPAPAEKSAEEKTDSKNILADITIDTNGNKVNAVDDKGNKMSFPPTATENNMVLMNGDKSIAVITEDGTHIKTVPNNWEPGALLNNATKPVERPAESAQAPATEPAQAPTTESAQAPATEPAQAPATESAQAPATEPAQAPTTEPAQAPATEPSPSKEEPKTEGPAIQILDKPLDLAQGVPEGFIPKNAVGVILAG